MENCLGNHNRNSERTLIGSAVDIAETQAECVCVIFFIIICILFYPCEWGRSKKIKKYTHVVILRDQPFTKWMPTLVGFVAERKWVGKSIYSVIWVGKSLLKKMSWKESYSKTWFILEIFKFSVLCLSHGLDRVLPCNREI